MSIRCVSLPSGSESESDSSDDLLPPAPTRHIAPKRAEVQVSIETPAGNPFEVDDISETTLTPMPVRDLDYANFGLPPLSFDSDPFLSPVEDVKVVIEHRSRRARETFSMSIGGNVILVAKRITKMLKRTWYISRSKDFSLDAPDLAGMVVRQRKGAIYSVLSARERQSDGSRQVLAGIKLGQQVFLGQDLWLDPKEDDVFTGPIPAENCCELKQLTYRFNSSSTRNAAFAIEGEDFCFLSERIDDTTMSINVRKPMCLVQAFGLAIALSIK